MFFRKTADAQPPPEERAKYHAEGFSYRGTRGGSLDSRFDFLFGFFHKINISLTQHIVLD